MPDLFENAPPAAPHKSAPVPLAKEGDYNADQIEVLEGLEPVRRRPGMYIGGTDSNAYHHLAAEILDNAMDEAVAGFATKITVSLENATTLAIMDNGRGIPVDPHPRFPDKSALEVILTTLHAGGKFSDRAYQTSGGLHGVGSSVVNALSEAMEVEVMRSRTRYRQDFRRGAPQGGIRKIGSAPSQRGTLVRFTPDHEIFGRLSFSPKRLYRLCKSKAALFGRVSIEWKCNPALLESEKSAPEEPSPLSGGGEKVPERALLHFPNGLADALQNELGEKPDLLAPVWSGEVEFPSGKNGKIPGRVEWALAFTGRSGGHVESFCNTIPTPQGGTHESGLRASLLKAFRQWGAQQKIRRASGITGEDILPHVLGKLSVFVRDPQFQGQTKEKLTSQEASRLVETALKDRLDHWFAADPAQATALTGFLAERAEERLRQKEGQEAQRKTATRKLRLPGKLTDCTSSRVEETEIFLVEGESAGGSARQARERRTQAILPLRGKILNVASATEDKLRGNQELRDLTEALGCGLGRQFDKAKLRYGRIIIMTDADVDGAHIASLLMTFFYREMKPLITEGHLYLAQPPLYRLTWNGKTVYAMNDDDREKCLKKHFPARAKVEISRFKGLGEMPMKDLKETTMNPEKRILLKMTVPQEEAPRTHQTIEDLMGKKPEPRFRFITSHASLVEEVDI